MYPVAPPSDACLVIKCIEALESGGFSPVYLRNHEGLPETVGNDVDLQVAPGLRRHAEFCISQTAREAGWLLIGRAEFSPLSVYFGHPISGETLHLDIFDRLEWKGIEYADANLIIQNRIADSHVHIPSRPDAVFLNLIGRLLQHGVIREKHRLMVQTALNDGLHKDIAAAFRNHLGFEGERLWNELAKRGFVPDPALVSRFRRTCVKHHAIRNPASACFGGMRIMRRAFQRLIHPPAPIIAFLFEKGMECSSVVDDLAMWLSEWHGGREPLRLIATPEGLVEEIRDSSAHKNHSTKSEGPAPRALDGILRISRHWRTWFCKILPARIRSHVVIISDLMEEEAEAEYLAMHQRAMPHHRFLPRPSLTVNLLNGEVNNSDPVSSAGRQYYAYGGRHMVVDASGSEEQLLHKLKCLIIHHFAEMQGCPAVSKP